MDYIINRREARDIQGSKGWLMLYGRRKVGKTFLLRELCRLKNYFLIKKDLSILSNIGIKDIKGLIEKVKELLIGGEIVVIDEFQRLNESVLEEIAQNHPHGRLIISGSSMRIIKKYFASQSSILGFFTPMKIGLIGAGSMLTELNKINCEKRIEFSSFLREPWLIPLFDEQNIEKFVYSVITKSRYIITALLGEIFSEEERELSKKYESILRLIGAGMWNVKEITNILFSRNLIPDSSPTHVIQYLKNLEEMELIEGIKLYKSGNKFFYRLKSPIMNIYYYLEDRYNIENRIASFEEVKPTLRKLISFEIQNFISDIFAEKFSGRKEYFISPSKEIDFIITKRNKPIIVGEVKWKDVSKKEIYDFAKISENFFCRKVLVCKSNSTGLDKAEDIEIFTADKICKL